MSYTFFYLSVLVVWIILGICLFFKKLRLENIIIGITTIAYSLIFDVTLGDYFDLYRYMQPHNSTLYMVLSAVFIYPLVNIIYTLFLPHKTRDILIYTGIWIGVMLLFEYASVVTKAVVFTGWQPFPWSIVTYLVTYTWIYFFYRYLQKKIKH